MTWHAAIMPDDALPPDSFVGRMLRPSADDVTWDTPKEVRMIGGRITDAEGEPIAEFVFDECSMKDGETYRLSYDAETGTVRPELLAEAEQFLEEYADDFKALAASERAELPLWRVMQDAGDDAWIESGHEEGQAQAAQIEALRDWLLPSEPEPAKPWTDGHAARPLWHRWHERQELRALLTEQARIARDD